VEYYHPIYREANTYPHLLSDHLAGNYERANGARVHSDAWPIVGREFKKRIDEWVDRYRELSPKGLATDKLGGHRAGGHRRPRAVHTRGDGEEIWGVLDRSTGSVLRHPKQLKPGTTIS